MKNVDGKQVRKILSKKKRVYLCGKLSKPEEFEFVNTDGLEIGISYYEKFTAEKAHYHQWNHEYNIVREGAVKVYLFEEKKEYEYNKDDMYVVEPNMQYITKAQPGTEVLFVKSPGGNDKKLINHTNSVMSWCEDWDAKMK